MKLKLAKDVTMQTYQLPKNGVTFRLPHGNEIEVPESASIFISQFDGKTSIKRFYYSLSGEQEHFGGE
jgi:hypothetical protein